MNRRTRQGGGRMRGSRFAIVSNALTSFLVGAGCAGDATSADPVAQADNRFGFKLFRELARSSPGANILVSPASIAFALGATYNGAHGETASELARCLELQGLDLKTVNRANADLLKSLQVASAGVELDVANSLWAEQDVTFRPAFIQTARNSYRAQVTTLDFQSANAVARINAWVQEKTRGKIDRIVERLSPDDVLVILNAVYFHGSWDEAFDAKGTRDQPFNLLDGSTRACPMMADMRAIGCGPCGSRTDAG